jgi:hypothetical protein
MVLVRRISICDGFVAHPGCQPVALHLKLTKALCEQQNYTP